MEGVGGDADRTEGAMLFFGPFVVALLSGCALCRFAERPTNSISFLASVLGLTLAFSILAVVPYDVWYALSSREPASSDKGMQTAALLHRSWAAIYWTTLLLCSIVCPILMEFESAGDFTVMARLRTSIRRSVAYYALYLIIGGAVLVWLFIRGDIHGGLQSWLLAASNAWGLLLLTVLMGHGLVDVPRSLRQQASPQGQLRQLYLSAVSKDEKRLHKLFDLQDGMEQVRMELAAQRCVDESPQVQHAVRLALRGLQDTLQRCEHLYWVLSHGRVSESAVRHDPASVLQPGARRNPEAHLDRLCQLHCTMKLSALEARRAVSCWDSHVQHCMFFEDISRGQFTTAAELFCVRPRSGSKARSFICLAWRRACTIWLRFFRSRVLLFLSYCCGIFSGVIVLGQLTMFNQRGSWSLSLLSYLFRDDHGPWRTQALCVLPLGYMACTAYSSIFRLRVPGWYGLYANHNTDMGSLLWCASILARLAAPLSYHFLLLVRVRGTTFQQFMGQMNVVPVLGESVNVIFPCIIAILCLFNLLNVYSRVVHSLSLGIIDFELIAGGSGEDPHTEGQCLIERERRSRSEDATLELPARERLAMPLAAPAG